MSPDFDLAVFTALVAVGVWAFFTIAERVLDARDRRRAVARARDLERGTITEVRPHLYVVAEPTCQVIHAEHRFAARRAVANGPMGGGAA